MLPPLLLHLRISTAEHRSVRLWLPLFLLWLLLVPFLLLALAIVVVADAILVIGNHEYHHYTALLLRTLGVLNAIRGTCVHVHDDQTLIDIDLR